MAIARTTTAEPAVGPGAEVMKPALMAPSKSVVMPNAINPNAAGFADGATVSAIPEETGEAAVAIGL
jgi:hypothetical protein